MTHKNQGTLLSGGGLHPPQVSNKKLRKKMSITELMYEDGIADELRNFVADPSFPCVGAKAALKRDQLEVIVAGDIGCPRMDRDITAVLQEFACENQPDQKIFVSQAVIFTNCRMLSETEFEARLWHRLNAIHQIDSEDFKWDPSVDSDPNSPHFSLSIGGRGFFVVGLHPGSSRQSRRFKYPTMIFNLHSQFERLRAEGRYESIRDTTIARDTSLCGEPNPMLAVHGTGPAAAQYSGRHVDEDWKCPFHA